MSDLAALTATAAADRIAAGEISSVELVRACLDRIAEQEPTIHAWQCLDADLAMAQARACDAAHARAPLHGVPVAIKDIIDTAELPTGYGSAIYAGHRPADDAVCVQRLRDAGAVVLGKTVTAEFATYHPGPTANPRDVRRTPGGSSSGSAAAVAASMVPVALGTQTAGSIVRPAGFCGVWGLKPTYGTYPLGGVRPVAPSLDTLGHFARSVEDLTLLAGVLGPPEHKLTGLGSRAAGLRIGFAPTDLWPRADAGTRAAITDLAVRLDAPLIELPEEFDGLPAAQEIIMAREALDTLGPERDRGEISEELHTVLHRGAALSEDAYREALNLASRCRALLHGVFADVDALLTPSVLGEAPVGLRATGDPLFCRAWTLLGVPTVAVPGLLGPAGMPLGVQVVATIGADATALAAARTIAEHTAASPAPT